MSAEKSQEYRGNGNHEWEHAQNDAPEDHLSSLVNRLRVPGGWLYRVYSSVGPKHEISIVFVPMPEVVKHKV